TNSIIVNFSMSAISGVINVHGTNTCGNGPASPDYAVTVNVIPPTPIVTVTGNEQLHSNIPNGNQWYFAGAPIPGATSQDYTATQTGYYWDVVTWSGCSSDTSNHVYVLITGIVDLPAQAQFNIFPVPNDGRFTVTVTYPTHEILNLVIYNNLGEKISEMNKIEVNGTIEKKIDLRPASPGIYSVVFEIGDKRVVKKIIITR
ncbi:MAG: T9SS type A sorting domain-containing protein, partial [Bacteroidota bacterium]